MIVSKLCIPIGYFILRPFLIIRGKVTKNNEKRIRKAEEITFASIPSFEEQEVFTEYYSSI